MPENDVKLLKPHIVAKVWGGERLAQLKGLSSEGPIGETWEVSVHPDGESSVAGSPLSKIISSEKLPYLVKLIDTSDDLSIQVHPGDDYAKKHEDSTGKTECWVILDAKPGAGIYLGLKAGITKTHLETALNSKEDISKLLNFYPVESGQFFFVPAGTIHAIGKDVFLAEIQQSSGITYRVWDWNRLGLDGQPRELHVQKAMDVINFSESFNQLENFKFQEGLMEHGTDGYLIEHPQFNVKVIKLVPGLKASVLADNNRAASVLCLDGEISMASHTLKSYEAALLSAGECEISAIKDSIFLTIE